MSYDYPPDLARFTLARWIHPTELPPLNQLTELLSCCYQASMLTEELNSVTFRAVLIEPDQLESQGGPPWGHHCLRFSKCRPLVPNTLVKLSPVVDLSRSLLGLRLGDAGFEIWGLINSGSRWGNSQYNRRKLSQPLTGSLVVAVTAPGTISVYNGSQLMAHLTGGKISGPTPEVLSSHWLEQVFQGVRAELDRLHASTCQALPSVEIDPRITRTLTQTTLRRALDLLRKGGHGGSLLIIPPEHTPLFQKSNPYLHLHHRFRDEDPRRLFRTLLTGVMQRLAELFPEAGRISWADFRGCQDPYLSELDEAFEEFSHLLCGLLAMDGAVLMTQRLELLAFGTEIAGTLPAVNTVYAAHDIEAIKTLEESTTGVGTRHRSVYRLCAQLPWMLSIVQSQDGRIRMVKNHLDRVTYWDQFGVGQGAPESS